MRSARAGLWLAAFLVAGSAPAFAQVILPPSGSGRTIPADGALVGPFQQAVHSTGTFDFTLAVLRNTSLRFFTSGTVCTTGPTTTVSIHVPLGKFGLVAGDRVTFVWTVRHRRTEHGTTSVIISIIPVVPAGGTPPTPTTTWLPRRAIEPGEAVAARREETA